MQRFLLRAYPKTKMAAISGLRILNHQAVMERAVRVPRLGWVSALVFSCLAMPLLGQEGSTNGQPTEPNALQWQADEVNSRPMAPEPQDYRAPVRSVSNEGNRPQQSVLLPVSPIAYHDDVHEPRPFREERQQNYRTAQRRVPSSRDYRRERNLPMRHPVRRPPWRGTLLPNTERGANAPPFIVVDRYGAKRRYITPKRNSNIERYLYRSVIVREDTGIVLKEDQLDFPISPLRTDRNNDRNEPRSSEVDMRRYGRSENARSRNSVRLGYLPNDEREYNRRSYARPRYAEDRYRDSRREERIDDDSRISHADYESDRYARPRYEDGHYSEERFAENRYYDQHYDAPRRDDYVRPAQYPEEIAPGEMLAPTYLPGSGPVYDSNAGYQSQGQGCTDCQANNTLGLGFGSDILGGCSSCQTGSSCGSSSCASCNRLPAVWFRAEYLAWWMDGMHLPPLVTSSPANTAQSAAGVLGQPGTTVLFGDARVLEHSRNGGRLRGGFGILPRLGVEFDLFGLNVETGRYRATGVNGTPIIGRPFFNVLTAQNDAELVSFPNIVDGTITVDTRSDLESWGIGLRYGLCCENISCGGCDACGTQRTGGISRISIVGGFRYMQLDEGVLIREDLVSQRTQNLGSTFIVQESFRTHNDFNGAEIGAVWEWEQTRWTLELLAKMAFGNNRQKVTINGNTVVSANGFSNSTQGGLLAQRSNIGRHQRNELSFIPELGATLGFKITPRLRWTLGCSFIYWSNVVRPGEHIDLDVNTNLLPPEVVPFAGPLRPRFQWDSVDLWVAGLNTGLEFRW